MARGDRREEIFRDDRDRWKFLGYLAEGAERYRVKVYCYVPSQMILKVTKKVFFLFPTIKHNLRYEHRRCDGEGHIYLRKWLGKK